MKLLLTSVFGPYGVDDKFGRKENIMELFHNQVTREQGVFSMRFNHESAGLHLMAENISVPTVVLDFPSLKRFVKEIKKGYDYIGISFIVPNFIKAKHMAELIRKHSPKSKIILGGHGTSIEDVEKHIPCDHVCKGDGVSFLRKLFKNDINAPITSPTLYSSLSGKHVMGAPTAQDAAVLTPGVGCQNSCRFCSTSHYFQRKYTSFLKTGKEVFDTCVRLEKKLGVTDFFIMDENFLKSEERARGLVAEMEKHGKAYSFGIFSSAEAVTRMGLDFIERMGVNFLWMGVESKKEVYEKNRGIDFKQLIKDLRNRGVSVLASGILFLEEHTKDTIHDDIDFLIGLKSDLVQFMQLGPLPGTRLYKDYDSKGLLLKDIPYEEWHGQHRLWFKHPHFTSEESEQYLRDAFKKEFEINGPSILRIADTAIRGVMHSKDCADPFMVKRHQQRISRAVEVYPLLDALCFYAPNRYAKELAHDVRERYAAFFGRKSLETRLKSAAVQALVFKERIRSTIVQNNMRQPKTVATTYRMPLEKLREASFMGRIESNILDIKVAFNQLPVQLKMSGILDRKNVKAFQSSVVRFLKEEKNIVLNFSSLQRVEEDALRRFLKKIARYRNQFKLIYSEKTEATRRTIEALRMEFGELTFIAAESY